MAAAPSKAAIVAAIAAMKAAGYTDVRLRWTEAGFYVEPMRASEPINPADLVNING